MIKRTKNAYLNSAATFAVLGSLLITGSFAHAQTGDALSSAASNAANNAVNSVKNSTIMTAPVDSGSAIGTNVPPDMGAIAPSAPVMPSNDTIVAPTHRTIGDTAAKFLDAISKHPTDREGKVPDWRIEQDKAVTEARAGHYDQALAMLDKLHAAHPENLGISTDYAAILGWAGRDADAVAAYKALAAGDRPDYLIDSIGHSYRNLHQPENALAVYQLGLQKYPDNQSFKAGEILTTLEAGKTADAKALAQGAETKYATPSDDLIIAIKTAYRADAVAFARNGQFKEALDGFAALHAKYPTDTAITGDYVAVLSWAGHDTESVTLYQSLTGTDQPDYVLDAAAHSYRNLRKPQQALDLYQAALTKNPDNVVYAVGAIYSLSDLGRAKEALVLAREQIAKHPEKPPELMKAYSYIQRRAAIDLARAGHYEQALSLLRELRREYPSDTTEQMDYIAVSSWAGHDAEATSEYKKIARQPMPDYVLEAVGGSYRRMKQPEKALVVFRRGLKQSPRNEIFAAGVVRCLNDLHRYAEGEKIAKEYTRRYGDRLQVLLAGGESSNANNESIEALNFFERANGVAPKNREALRGVVQSEDHLGASHLALKTANKHPGLLKADEYRALVGNADSALVRWGPLEPASESTRYVETDAALASLDSHIAKWSAMNKPSVYPNIQRARFDRIVALRDRSRMQDAVAEYNALVQEGVVVPGYALEAVGEAYLYLREPEIARDLFLKALETQPNSFETRRLLSYAYLECAQYDEAYATSDKILADEPQWIYLKGEPERQPNPERAIAELDSGGLRQYVGLTSDADERLTPIVEAGPYDPRSRAAAGNLAMAQGLPRAALQEYEIGLAIQNGKDVNNELGIGNANLALQRFPEAEAKTQDLVRRFPENLNVQRLDRDWQIHNMAEIDVRAGYAFPPSGDSTTGISPNGQGFNIGAELYSSPILYNWRLFAGENFAHEHEPNVEGTVGYSRTNAGVEYRNGDVTATVAPTFNNYTADINGTDKARERVGADGTLKYTFDDMWTASIAAELFAPSTPLRALGAGVTADRFDANLLWRQDDTRQILLDAYVMPFSDGNFRSVEDAELIQRLYTDPNFRLDGEINLASSQNTKDENRLYYNPSFDFTALAGLRGTHTLYRRYETLYEHSLLAMPGLYSQKKFGTSPAWLVRYEHRLRYDNTLNAGVGVNYSHQDFDGSVQDAVSLTMDVVERF